MPSKPKSPQKTTARAAWQARRARRDASGFEHIGKAIREKNIIIKGADAITKQGFTQVPNYFLRNPDLSLGAKMTYAMLLSYAWHDDYCFPGQVRLAQDLAVSERSVRTYMRELEKPGYVTVERRGLGKPNLYTLYITVGK